MKNTQNTLLQKAKPHQSTHNPPIKAKFIKAINAQSTSQI